MKIRWKGTTVLGTFHNDPAGVREGQVVEVDDANAQRYINHGLAEPVNPGDLEAHY